MSFSNKYHNKIELLAPAKNKKAGIAAIRCGADAVYIGASKFGARSAAGNDLTDIQELVEYAHIFRVKVYATLNTLLKNEELDDARKLSWDLYNIGIDGIIIQDMAFLEMDLPPVKLIASTQVNNADKHKVRFLEDVGFQRVILARELSLQEIRKIRSDTDIELETFIHGALCVSYSGQCYLSYALGGRSGNRGVCAQPCRDTYSLVDSQGRIIKKDAHLLSLQDLCLENHLEDLLDAGVTSFKIEGRLKDEAYIMNIVAFYRQKLDGILRKKGLQKSSIGTVFHDFTPDPKKTFNRGYTNYFIDGGRKTMASMDTPKSKGEYIGTVISVEKNVVVVKSETQLHSGDGICFFDRNNRLTGTNINQVSGNRFQAQDSSGIKKGTGIYRNFDKEFMDSVMKSKTGRKIKVKISLLDDEHGVILKISDEEKTEASMLWPSSGQVVQDMDKYREVLRKNLAKMGNTDFHAEDVDIQTGNLTFSTIKEINHARRKLTEALIESRQKAYVRESFSLEKNNVSYPEKSLDYSGNVLNRLAEIFYERHGVTSIEPAAEASLDMHGRVVMKCRYCIKHEIGLCSKFARHYEFFGVSETCEKPDSFMVSGLAHNEPLFLLDKNSNRIQLDFSCAICHMTLNMEKK